MVFACGLCGMKFELTSGKVVKNCLVCRNKLVHTLVSFVATCINVEIELSNRVVKETKHDKETIE